MTKIGELVPVHSIADADLASVFKEAEKAKPELWRQCYPRIYKPYKEGDYASPKTIARQMFSIALKVEMMAMQGHTLRPRSDQVLSEHYEIIWASVLAQYRVPTYYVTRDMATAITQTVPPITLDWYNMELPFPGMAFILPKGFVTHDTEGDVEFISFSRTRKAEWVNSLASVGPKQWASENGSIILFAKTKHYLTHFNIPVDYFPTVDLKMLDETITKYESNVHSSGWWNTATMSKADTKMGIQIAHLLFGLLLMMTRRPKYVQPATLASRLPAKKGERAKEFWNPAVIGCGYEIKRISKNLGGTHASPRYHWVRGYWKDIRYGPNMQQVREDWIQPYERGLDEIA